MRASSSSASSLPPDASSADVATDKHNAGPPIVHSNEPDLEAGLHSSQLSSPMSPQQKDTSLLEDIAAHRRTTLTWRGIKANVPIFNAKSSLTDRLRPSKAPAKTRQVLFGATGIVRPGEVLALMGPSGSGKTTLISILGGRVPKGMTVSGEILFNGQSLDRSIKRNIGYVLQDDRLYDALTVYETLVFAARLRLPRQMSLEEKVGRVEAVISALGLEKCRNTLIGGPMRRGVSGGERKRVSVGHELLTDPAILMLDEPSSGLDSSAAMKLVSTLHTLATQGRTVVTTIHQPSSRLYQQLDRLMLLSDGHVLYQGQGASVHSWFEALGHPVPFGVNVADFILDLASGDFVWDKSVAGVEGPERKQKLIEVSETFLDQFEDGYHSSPSGNTEEDDRALQQLAEGKEMQTSEKRSLDSYLPQTESMRRREKRKQRRLGASYLEQLTVLSQRSAKTQRFEALGTQKFLQLTSVAVIAGLFWWDRGSSSDLKSAADVAALLFFQGIFMSFSSLFAALFTFPSELGMIMKERSSDMYRLSAYYIARTASTLPLDLLYPTAFTIIIYWMGGLRADAGIFISSWLSLMLGVLVAQSFGLIIGAGVSMVKQAQTIATIVMLSFMLVGGFWVKNIPSWIEWLKYFSFMYWLYSLLTKLQFGGETYYDCLRTDSDVSNDIANIADCQPVSDLQRTLALPNDVNDPPLVDVGALFLMLIILRVGVYFVLWRKTRNA